ncbi:MAG: hypothetical protein SWO11_14510 [Thermodesulfobacteriota bacterium]|nr:hypothetical protein [Thermodesulfobacteriota bacterium]
MKLYNKSIKNSIELAQSMLDLADEGDAAREDESCGVLYAVIRDSAYSIKRLAEAEKNIHKRKGLWN